MGGQGHSLCLWQLGRRTQAEYWAGLMSTFFPSLETSLEITCSFSYSVTNWVLKTLCVQSTVLSAGEDRIWVEYVPCLYEIYIIVSQQTFIKHSLLV